jgi:hypothetical protein
MKSESQHRFHLQDWSVSQARNQHEAGSKHSWTPFCLQNVGWPSLSCTALYCRRQKSSRWRRCDHYFTLLFLFRSCLSSDFVRNITFRICISADKRIMREPLVFLGPRLRHARLLPNSFPSFIISQFDAVYRSCWQCRKSPTEKSLWSYISTPPYVFMA